MLDLLTQSLKVQKPSITNFIDENRLEFWFNDILPLLLDQNITIQNNAIIAIETLIPFLDVSNYEKHPDWLNTSTTIKKK